MTSHVHRCRQCERLRDIEKVISVLFNAVRGCRTADADFKEAWDLWRSRSGKPPVEDDALVDSDGAVPQRLSEDYQRGYRDGLLACEQAVREVWLELDKSDEGPVMTPVKMVAMSIAAKLWTLFGSLKG